jgi:hemolysin III
MSDAAPHYPSPTARQADLVVHVLGLAFATLGGLALLGLTVTQRTLTQTAAIAIYVAGLVAMLALSAAYNFARARWRPMLRRLDHAGIFLMIAGSYTPFTTQRLHGLWAIWMTAAVWGLASLGVIGKLFLPGLGRKFWVAIYIALGWLAVVAIEPLIDGTSWVALALLAVGGIVYSTGAVFYISKQLTFRRAIWHGHVVGALMLHYAAVLVGVVLARAAG